MTHKDAIGQDIMPDDIVAWSRMGSSAGPRFARVIGESPKMIRVTGPRFHVKDVDKSNNYGTSVDPQNVIVITKLVP